MAETGTGQDGMAFNRRQALGLAGAAAGAVGVTAASATAATARDDDDDDKGGAVKMRSVSLAQAEEVIRAAIRFVERNKLPAMFVVVVDVCGDEKASARMDGNGPASVVLAPIKARTSAAFRTATAQLAANVTDPAAIASFTTAGFSLLGGGHPLREGDMVIGAIGIGGGTPAQDAQVAEAAAAAIG